MTSRHVLEGTEFKNYILNYDAENRLTSVAGAATANFVYDGDGKQVKATVNGITAVYVGQHYEVKNGIVTKYYPAGATRIAVRRNGLSPSFSPTTSGVPPLPQTRTESQTAQALYRESSRRGKAFGETRYREAPCGH